MGQRGIVIVALLGSAGCFVEAGTVEDDAADDSGSETGEGTGTDPSDDGASEDDGESDAGTATDDDSGAESSGAESSGEESTGGDAMDCGECPGDALDPCLVPACVAGQCVLEDHGIVVYGFGDSLPLPERKVYGLDPEAPPAASYGPAVPMFRVLDTALPGTSTLLQVQDPTKPDWIMTFDPAEGQRIGYGLLPGELGHAWPLSPDPPPGAIPVHRYYRSDTLTHVQATDEALTGNSAFTYEGASIYACPP